MLHTLELQWIYWIQQLRGPFLDSFFTCLDFFDGIGFFFILIPLVWFGNGWKAGLRLYYILFLSSFTNQILKGWFQSPRPFHIDPHVGIIQIGGLGFPSGAAQTVILLSGLLVAYWKNPLKWPIVFAYILLISFSRVYLGVHFPSDILGGWIVGGGLLALYLYTQAPLEKYLTKSKPVFLLILSQLFPLLLFYLKPTQATLRLSSIAMGIGLGLFLIHLLLKRKSGKFWQIRPQSTTRSYIVRVVFGILTTLICYLLFSFLFPSFIFIRYFILGLWLGLSTYFLKKILPKK